MSRPWRADAIVVLGRGVRRDGSLGLIARGRVERALELHALHVAPRIIFSGCTGLMADTAPVVTEAEAMASYAMHRGLDRSAILLEDQSRDTIGNAYFTRIRWLEPNDWRAIRVVTSDFHVPRASWLFEKVLGRGFDVSFSAASSERFGSTIGLRALDETDIAAFLAEWLSEVPDGDLDAIEAFIRTQHPAYAASPAMTKHELKARVDAIGRARRTAELHRPVPAVVRRIEDRLADL